MRVLLSAVGGEDGMAMSRIATDSDSVARGQRIARLKGCRSSVFVSKFRVELPTVQRLQLLRGELAVLSQVRS